MSKDDIEVIEYKILKYLYENIKAELDVSNIMFERGYTKEEYEEQKLHLIIKEACRKCGMKYCRRNKS